MTNDWRLRLRAAAEASEKSWRQISLEAGRGPGYLHGVLEEGKDPSVENLISICGAIGVSFSQISSGVDVTPETEEILSLIENRPDMREAILLLLKS